MYKSQWSTHGGIPKPEEQGEVTSRDPEISKSGEK
jgi:hypothetical protein